MQPCEVAKEYENETLNAKRLSALPGLSHSF